MKLSAPPPPPPPPPEPPAPGDQPPPDPTASANTAGAAAPTSPDAPQAAGATPPGSPETVATPAPTPEPSGPPEKPLLWPSWYPGVDSALAGLVLLLAFAAASFVARNSDAWVHLAAGKRLFQGEYFPGGSDPFSFSAADRTWVNHSWLTDAVSYLLYGGEGKVLGIAKALVVLVAFGFVLAIRRPQFSLWPWAVAACIAVLAAAPYLTLRPHVVSMLFLAITCFVVLRMPRGTNPWQFPIAIGITFWLWANCDSWFILGPISLGLLLVGELIQQNMFNTPEPPESEAGSEPLGRMPPLGVLAKALGIGVVACMLNPHHVRVWELPFDLTGAPGATDETRLRVLLMPVYDEFYYDNASLGRNLNGLMFLILGVLGAVAAVLALSGISFARLRVAHGLLLMGFLLLACFRVSTIPFFAIVAIPFIAAELNALSTRAKLKTWSDSKSRMLWIGSSAGRLVCVLGVCALVVLSYPGWIQPDSANLAYARRVGWGVEPDPLLVQASQQLNQWREQEKLSPDTHGIIANTELANYVAWYAPREKVYINSRYNHHKSELGNYLKLRRALGITAGKDDPFDLSNTTEVMKEANAEYLAVSGNAGDSLGSRARMNQATSKLYLSWQGSDLKPTWLPWYLDGQTTIFGWRAPDASGKPEFTALRVDPVALAFAPDTPRLPETKILPPLVDPSKWEEAFVRPVKPAPSAGTEAVGWIQYKQPIQPRRQQLASTRARYQAYIAQRLRLQTLLMAPNASAHQLLMLKVASPTLQPEQPPPNPQTPEPSGDDEMAARAAPILALRAARRAIHEDQDHPEPYFILAQALGDSDLPLSESERALGILIAQRQCLNRLPKIENYRKGQYSISPAAVALLLARWSLGNSVTCQIQVTRVAKPGFAPNLRLISTSPAQNAKRQVKLVQSGKGEDPQVGAFQVSIYEITIPYLGMPLDIPGLNNTLADQVVIRLDPSGNPVALRVPVASVNANDPGQIVIGGPTMLALDSAYETFQLALQYAKIELTAEGSEEMKPDDKQRYDQFEAELKDVQAELVKSNNAYESTKASGAKLPVLVESARRNSLLGQQLKLLQSPSEFELKLEFKEQMSFVLLVRLNLELTVGKIEDLHNILYGEGGLATPEKLAGEEKSPLFPMLQQVRYQKALHAGEYDTAGKIWEATAGNSIGVFDTLPPREFLLNTIRFRYQAPEPEKVLAGLIRPPLLIPVHPLMQPIYRLAQDRERATAAGVTKPRFQSLMLDAWLSDWTTLIFLMRQQVAEQLQGESNFFYRRGVLAVLEGDIPGAKKRFQQATRKPPEGWGVPGVAHTDANGYLQMIEMAEKKAAK